MQTTLTTKDGKKVTIDHRSEIPDHEQATMNDMDFRRVYHVGCITGFKIEQ